MTIQNFKFELLPKLYGIKSDSSPAKFKIKNIKLYETWEPNPKHHSISKELGDYRICFEKSVKTTKELQNAHFEILELIGEIDRAWLYATGHPLTKKDFAFMAPILSFPGVQIPGWTSNYDEIENDINRGKTHIKISSRNVHHSILSYWPLERAIEIREKYLHALDHIKALIDLHFFALKVDNGYAMLFFLAKGLELVRSILPGKDNFIKEKHLPEDVINTLHNSFHFNLGLSNTRYEIRHAVKDPKNSTLHPKLSNNELESFKNDADLIIRAVVAMELDVPLCVPNRN